MKISFGKKFNERGKYMKYLDLVEKLQKAPENDGNIVMIKNGIFFVGVGKDAIILNNLLGLKLTCMKNELCKGGFQTTSIEKYVKKLQETTAEIIERIKQNGGIR